MSLILSDEGADSH